MKELNLEDILSRTTELKEKKVGYVSIIGRPNAGKSTFVNSLI
jgi:GTP-binding protein Era|tara:strand:+ start:580 stop:708 length:129 start_codon:yes stop_codon:yes gene_type:complete